MGKRKYIISAILSCSFLMGCSATSGRNETGGTVVGGVAGALIGSQFGGGTGRIAGTALGALGGAFVGNQVGQRMDETDHIQPKKGYYRSKD